MFIGCLKYLNRSNISKNERFLTLLSGSGFKWVKQLESKKKLGEEDREEEGQRQGEEGSGEEENQIQIVGTKRNRRVGRKEQRQVSRKRTFLDAEA